ncbi:MAG: 3-hydroxyacyl-CoA dehydrogenase NAD-binding domain-containing protein [Pseudomonadota bacterium]|nr:3-hydroxyacyl-CoA dehydrogenase NAD-binding domain-containing protein [Pseudomonadota bacterium]
MISKVAIWGAGTMGTGIAIAALNAGHKVQLVERDGAARSAARRRIAAFFERAAAKGKLSPETVAERIAGLQVLDADGRLAPVDLAIEAVFEDLDVKRKVLAMIEEAVPATAIIATNTSCLDLDELGTTLKVGERFLGLHFFSPAELNPVVETVRCSSTGDSSFMDAVNWVHQIGKSPITCLNRPGFAINRFFCPYANEAVRCYEEGLGTIGQIDDVARTAFDVPFGPFAVMNITKPEILFRAQSTLAKLGPFYTPSGLLSDMSASRQLWEIEGTVDVLPRSLATVVSDRLMGAVFKAVGDALAEGVASPEDIDTGAALALRFGRPPVSLMKALGDEKTGSLVRAVAVGQLPEVLPGA